MIQIHDDKDDNTTIVVFMAPRLLRGRPRIHDNWDESRCIHGTKLIIDDGSFILDVFIFVTKIHDDDNESDNNTWMSFCDDYSAADFGLAAVFGGSVAVRRPSRADALLCFGAVFALAADFGSVAIWTALYCVCFNPRTPGHDNILSTKIYVLDNGDEHDDDDEDEDNKDDAIVLSIVG